MSSLDLRKRTSGSFWKPIIWKTIWKKWKNGMMVIVLVMRISIVPGMSLTMWTDFVVSREHSRSLTGWIPAAMSLWNASLIKQTKRRGMKSNAWSQVRLSKNLSGWSLLMMRSTITLTTYGVFCLQRDIWPRPEKQNLEHISWLFQIKKSEKCISFRYRSGSAIRFWAI